MSSNTLETYVCKTLLRASLFLVVAPRMDLSEGMLWQRRTPISLYYVEE
jgi:hypothetical protein